MVGLDSQWVIDAFKRFQISDELPCDKFGYKKVSKEDKAKIFGLNAAAIYDVDPGRLVVATRSRRMRCSRLRVAYLEHGGQPENAAHGWVLALTPKRTGFSRPTMVRGAGGNRASDRPAREIATNGGSMGSDLKNRVRVSRTSR